MDKEKLEKAVEWANRVLNSGKHVQGYSSEWMDKADIGAVAAAEIVLEKHEFESRVVEAPVSPAMVKISVDEKSYTMEEIQAIIRDVNQEVDVKIYKPQLMGPPIEAVVIGGRYFTMDEYKEMMKEGDPRV